MTELQKQTNDFAGITPSEFWNDRRALKAQRDGQIQDLIANGLSNRDIAAITGVSTKTVSRRRAQS